MEKDMKNASSRRSNTCHASYFNPESVTQQESYSLIRATEFIHTKLVVVIHNRVHIVASSVVRRHAPDFNPRFVT
jgi:hypothetical protein